MMLRSYYACYKWSHEMKCLWETHFNGIMGIIGMGQNVYSPSNFGILWDHNMLITFGYSLILAMSGDIIEVLREIMISLFNIYVYCRATLQ